MTCLSEDSRSGVPGVPRKYFWATMLVETASSLGDAEATIDQIARRHSVSAKYLNLVWQTLGDESIDIGALDDEDDGGEDLRRGLAALDAGSL